MQSGDLRNLLALAAIWGGSFVLMKIAVPDFGPVALVVTRVWICAAFLLAITIIRSKTRALIAHWKPIVISSLLNVVAPFLCLTYAVQNIPAGTLSVINAMAPLFGGLIAWLWLGEQLSRTRVLGLAIGFSGILILMMDKLSFTAAGLGWVTLVALGGPLFYGLGACHLSKYLRAVEPVANAAGSMAVASIILSPLALWFWPPAPISKLAWLSIIVLAVLCTGVAYLLYYGLVARIGASRSIATTFLIPPFSIGWAAILLGEALTLQLILGAAIVLAGTMLATGFIAPGRRP